MVTASAGCLDFGPPPFHSSDPNCPSGPSPLVPIQVNVSNWTGGVVTFTVRAVCGGPAMMPGNLTYKVRSANNTVFLNGTVGTGPEVLGARVTLVFHDANASGWVDRGDVFTLSIDPPDRDLLLAGGSVDAYNDSRHSNFVGLSNIPFPIPPHVGLSVASHSGNITTIAVTSVEGLPPTPFDELKVTIYTRSSPSDPYFGHDVSKSWLATLTHRDADADGALSAGDQLVLSVAPSHAGEQTGGRLEVVFHVNSVGILEPLP